jgi:hypothetical protein
MNPYEPKRISEYIDEIKTIHRRKCSENLPEDQSKKRTQCALLSMTYPSRIIYGTRAGGGVQGEVKKFTMELDSEENDYIRNSVGYINNNSVIKSGREKKDGTELRTEAYIGLYLDLISDMAPNFSYSHDIRRLNPLFSSNERIMFGSQINTADNNSEYGILNEYIEGNTLFNEQNPRNSPKIQEMLKQLLFSLYIACKEIGFVHYDLHSYNILVIESDSPQMMEYQQIPLSPSTFISVYGTSSIYTEYRSYWDNRIDLYRNVWILDDQDVKEDDVTNSRVPIHLQDLQDLKESKEFLRIPRTRREDGKYEQDYHYLSLGIQSRHIPKIIDYGFSSVYFRDTFVVNPIAQELVYDYQYLRENLPTQPYLCIDVWKMLYYLSYGWNNGEIDRILSEPVLVEIFGERYMQYLFTKYNQLINQGISQGSAIQFHVGQFKYLDNPFVVEQKILPDYIKDNERFMNKCLVAINNMNNYSSLPVASAPPQYEPFIPQAQNIAPRTPRAPVFSASRTVRSIPVEERKNIRSGPYEILNTNDFKQSSSPRRSRWAPTPESDNVNSSTPYESLTSSDFTGTPKKSDAPFRSRWAPTPSPQKKISPISPISSRSSISPISPISSRSSISPISPISPGSREGTPKIY